MRVTIESAANGWILTGPDNEGKMAVYVFDDDAGEIECWADVLGAVNELIGPMSSRHSEHRVYVTVHPGDKHEKFTNELL
jgi:hypothetical protein